MAQESPDLLSGPLAAWSRDYVETVVIAEISSHVQCLNGMAEYFNENSQRDSLVLEVVNCLGKVQLNRTFYE
jgi:hypothetical protein